MINEGKDHTFCTKTDQRKLSKLGYKRRVVKKRLVVKQVNRKNVFFFFFFFCFFL